MYIHMHFHIQLSILTVFIILLHSFLDGGLVKTKKKSMLVIGLARKYSTWTVRREDNGPWGCHRFGE